MPEFDISKVVNQLDLEKVEPVGEDKVSAEFIIKVPPEYRDAIVTLGAEYARISNDGVVRNEELIAFGLKVLQVGIDIFGSADPS